MNGYLTEALPIEQLPDAPAYFPLDKGRYEVKPGLLKLGTDLGNGVWDQRFFQIDDNFNHYHRMKQLVRTEDLKKYYQTQDFTPEVERVIARFILERLPQEYPHYFQNSLEKNCPIFHNQLTGETLYFDANYCLKSATGLAPGIPPYHSALDALANQVQEDITVVSQAGERHWVSAIHVCFPNHWAVEAKIGREFAQIHAPVAGMTGMNRRGCALVQTMITQPPMVRFAWGLSTDTRLNHHPEPPPQLDPRQWQGRNFMPHDPQLYIRLERQVIWGFPSLPAALFTIRTYFRDVGVIRQNPTQCAQLRRAIQSMSPESLIYKGLALHQGEILAWLGEHPSQ
ncbi:hypothetical protein GlitD10_1719 [Gloeomargarita lithophora Alchichica-D10]|uniref:DUF3445 domain-containing protein n=1 Tax=Gloeomargarita lithophora Alchichica-D10 TaxID=1188229 RepID=A0A1J0ADN0_9CYAN|nr:DUF3445 domain-containing protein [Gloeomargarita lithophora]APB34044.1 hypothetical protein GlitD10_1719 [Gloeomargarita lithophora Alchichica-D10]